MNTRTITPLPPADFTPEIGNYRSLHPFRYWCQKVLPLVYDDSLSYYELLCKVIDYLNKTMEDVETLHSDVTNLHKSYEELQSYVNNYFSSLDVQEEINNKLDEMATSGELLTLFYKYLGFVNPKWFGAVGDGVADDTEPIKKALQYNTVYFQDGNYLCSTLTINKKCTLIGTDNSNLINKDNDICMILENVNDLVIKNIGFINTKNYALKLSNSNANNITIRTYNTLKGIQILNSWGNVFSECKILRCDNLCVDGDNCNSSFFNECLFSATSAYDCVKLNNSNVNFTQCTVDTGVIHLINTRAFFDGLRTESAKNTFVCNNSNIFATNCDIERHADTAAVNTDAIFVLVNSIMNFNGTIRYQDYSNLNWKTLSYYSMKNSKLYLDYISIGLLPNNVYSPDCVENNLTNDINNTNMLDLNKINMTSNGITITTNDDNSYTITGTATATFFSPVIASVEYAINGNYGLSGANYDLQLFVNELNQGDSGSGYQFNANKGDKHNITIELFSGKTYNVTIYPNLKLIKTLSMFNQYTGRYGFILGDLSSQLKVKKMSVTFGELTTNSSLTLNNNDPNFVCYLSAFCNNATALSFYNFLDKNTTLYCTFSTNTWNEIEVTVLYISK